MKILPLFVSCLSLFAPVCDYKVGAFFESDRYANVSLCSEGNLFREDIKIVVKSGSDELEIEPEVSMGYSPSIFVGNFLNNGLDQIFYSVESGGSGGYGYYQLFSLKGGAAKSVFSSSDFSSNVTLSYVGENVEIVYDNQKLYLDGTKSQCKEDCELYLSDVNAIFPTYNISACRYDLTILQRVYAGYSANTLGYVTTLLQVSEDGTKILNVGVLSNFEG